jgi:hypothetical protein
LSLLICFCFVFLTWIGFSDPQNHILFPGSK